MFVVVKLGVNKIMVNAGVYLPDGIYTPKKGFDKMIYRVKRNGLQKFGWCIDIKNCIVIWDDGSINCYTNYGEFTVLFASSKKDFMCLGDC
jgi:hypothetical protein